MSSKTGTSAAGASAPAVVPVDPRLPGARHPKRLCEVCLGYDDHPRIVMAVTTDGPLGLHTPSEVASVGARMLPLLPANLDEVEIRLRGLTPAQREQVYLDMVPDVDEYDAIRAWHQFMHPDHFDAHLDCYIDMPRDLQPQLAIDAFHEDEAGRTIQHSWADERKVMPDDHTLEGVRAGLKGDALRRHLIGNPARDLDHSHGVPA